MSTENDKMHRTPSLDREGVFSIVKDIGQALSSNALNIRHSQSEGVFVFLPERDHPVVITHGDFEKILSIFEDGPWASKLSSLRDRNVASDDELYEATIREAIIDYFPEFEDL